MSLRLSRRRWLQLGLIVPGTVTSRRTFAGESASFGRAKRCVLLYLTGGAPQHDTFDPKPRAPVEIRGELSAIATSQPGVEFTELFPRLARRAHQLTVVRSITHDDTVHTSAGYAMLTGWRHPQANAATAADIRPQPTDRPHLGSILGVTRPPAGPPPFIALPEVIKDAAVNEFPGLNGGFLGTAAGPLLVEGAAETGRFRPPPLILSPGVTGERFKRRRLLLEQIDPGGITAETGSRSRIAREQWTRAMNLLGSRAVGEAFELEREPAAVRDRYGPHLFGQGCLMARRLLEVGVTCAAVYWHYEGPDDSPVWDTHWNNYPHLRRRLAPPSDQAIAALLEDLSDRGLLDDTLVVVMGEFGRSPRLNDKAGRDHWPFVSSLLLAGAGTPAGTVYGASDREGAYPANDAVKPADFMATLLHLLGVDAHQPLRDAVGRPHPVIEGTPIAGLLG